MATNQWQWANHLCGNIYATGSGAITSPDRCPNLLYVDKPGMMHGKKPLKLYNAYCLAEGRCRSLGCVSNFTGNSPTWCPRRKEMEGRE